MKDLPLIEVKEISEKPINQYHEQLLKQANEKPVSEKNWNDPPTQRMRFYDWPESESR